MHRRTRLVTAALALITTGCASTSRPAANTVTASPPPRTGVSAGPIVLPPAGARFSYQLGGAYPPPAGVRIVDRDRSDVPAAGRYSICYVNAFQAQPGEVGWWQQHHPELLLRHGGELVIDAQWHEPLFDLRQPDRLLAVVGGWLDGCARSGFQAIEADNLDSYTRSDGLLTADQALAFAHRLTVRAHADGLAIAQKNAAELSPRARAAGFDFAVAEECQVWDECGSYTASYGRAVIEIEYTDQSRRFFTEACRRRGTTISVVRRDRQLLPAGQPGHVEQWC